MPEPEIIYVPPSHHGSLEDYYNDTMAYLFDRYHQHAPEDDRWTQDTDNNWLAGVDDSHLKQKKQTPKGKQVK